MPAQQFVSACFTVNNPTGEDRLLLISNAEWFRYLVHGDEVGSMGTPHIQGFAMAFKRTSFAVWKTKLPLNCHIEATKGTPHQAAAYCKKDGHWVEHGTPPQQGKRNDLLEAMEKIKANAPLVDVVENNPAALRCIKQLKEYKGMLIPKRNTKPEVTVLIGSPGVNKSRDACEQAERDGTVYMKPDGEWWDGYEGQTTIIMDDFCGQYPYRQLLKVLDRYQMTVPYKGGFTQLNSPKIIITSNREPYDWYKKDESDRRDINALYRRISFYWNYDRVSSDPVSHVIDW